MTKAKMENWNTSISDFFVSQLEKEEKNAVTQLLKKSKKEEKLDCAYGNRR